MFCYHKLLETIPSFVKRQTFGFLSWIPTCPSHCLSVPFFVFFSYHHSSSNFQPLPLGRYIHRIIISYHIIHCSLIFSLSARCLQETPRRRKPRHLPLHATPNLHWSSTQVSPFLDQNLITFFFFTITKLFIKGKSILHKTQLGQLLQIYN